MASACHQELARLTAETAVQDTAPTITILTSRPQAPMQLHNSVSYYSQVEANIVDQEIPTRQAAGALTLRAR